MVEVPGVNLASLHAWRDVAHGIVHRHFYHSQVTGSLRSMLVYTPPAYQLDAESAFPVLYLLHGLGMTKLPGRKWVVLISLPITFLADNQSQPMIVVMLNGHPLPIPGDPVFDDYAPENLRAMEAEIRQEIIPYVEQHYRIEKGREHRAIAGLSMGRACLADGPAAP